MLGLPWIEFEIIRISENSNGRNFKYGGGMHKRSIIGNKQTAVSHASHRIHIIRCGGNYGFAVKLFVNIIIYVMLYTKQKYPRIVIIH